MSRKIVSLCLFVGLLGPARAFAQECPKIQFNRAVWHADQIPSRRTSRLPSGPQSRAQRSGFSFMPRTACGSLSEPVTDRNYGNPDNPSEPAAATSGTVYVRSLQPLLIDDTYYFWGLHIKAYNCAKVQDQVNPTKVLTHRAKDPAVCNVTFDGA